MRVISSRPNMMSMVCLAAVIFLGACGYLDDDIGLSDDEFEASLGRELGVSGRGTGGTYGHGYGSGCGIGLGHSSYTHHSAHHPSLGRLVTTGHPGTTVIHMDPSHISARSGANAGVIVRGPSEEDESDEETSGAPIYAAGELETWGDYLEAELRRGQ